MYVSYLGHGGGLNQKYIGIRDSDKAAETFSVSISNFVIMVLSVEACCFMCFCKNSNGIWTEWHIDDPNYLFIGLKLN